MAHWCDDAAHGREQRRLDAEQERALERMARTRTTPFPGAPAVMMMSTPGGDCSHADAFDGPRIPLRYGSAATLICRSCSAWRQNRPGFTNKDWQPADTLDEAMREDDEL